MTSEPDAIFDAVTGAPLFLRHADLEVRHQDSHTSGWTPAGADDVYSGLWPDVSAGQEPHMVYLGDGLPPNPDAVGSWDQSVVLGCHWATEGSWLGDAFKSVGRAVSKPLKSVGKLAEDAVKVAKIPAKVAQGALNVVTHNPAWDLAHGAVSFVPVLGTTVSAGMAVAAQVGKGGSALDFALAAAKGTLPGQPVSGYAFDVAVGLLLKGQKLDAQALKIARDQCPGGDLGKKAFDLATSIILGKQASVGDKIVAAAKGALPASPILRAGFEAGAGLAKAKFASPKVVQGVVKALPPAARSAFAAGMASAKSRQITPRTVAAIRANAPPAVRQAVDASLLQAVKTRVVEGKRTLGSRALMHGLAAMRRSNEPGVKARIAAIRERAQRGDRAAISALALFDLADKTLRWKQVPKLPAAAAAGGPFGDILAQGRGQWIAPRTPPAHRKWFLAY